MKTSQAGGSVLSKKEGACAALLALLLATCVGASAAEAAPRVLALDAATPGLQSVPDRRREVEQALQAWKLAWELGEADTYLRFYDPQYRGQAPSRAHWEKERRSRLAKGRISVDMEALRIRLLSQTDAEVSFVQRYMSAGHRDAGAKRLRLRRGAGAWRITDESWAPLP